MFDPLFRDSIGGINSRRKKESKKEIEEKILSNIKNINIDTNIEDKKIDVQKKENIPLLRKIHLFK